ncbi:hypothetical protein [Streptomyces sp. NBC_00344]|uniref:hypothetical protein n=1 Tax=Streptomyces sp. NBC_00344 TaxID=2975720 RepID=UPI002E1E48D6
MRSSTRTTSSGSATLLASSVERSSYLIGVFAVTEMKDGSATPLQVSETVRISAEQRQRAYRSQVDFGTESVSLLVAVVGVS